MLYLSSMKTPLGIMRMAAVDEGICLFDFQYRKSMDGIMKRVEQYVGDAFTESDHPHFDLLKQQVDEYFTGTRQSFDLPLHLAGSPFQVSVWRLLMGIPYGETRSYKMQSIALGNEKAIRAVAGANGENGIAIIVPCHRVIGANGSLVGYGGGLPNKKWLLEHEARHSGKTGQLDLF